MLLQITKGRHSWKIVVTTSLHLQKYHQIVQSTQMPCVQTYASIDLLKPIQNQMLVKIVHAFASEDLLKVI